MDYELTLTQEGRDIEVLRLVPLVVVTTVMQCNFTGMNLDDDKFYSAIINVKVDGKALPRETTNCIAGTRIE